MEKFTALKLNICKFVFQVATRSNPTFKWIELAVFSVVEGVEITFTV